VSGDRNSGVEGEIGSVGIGGRVALGNRGGIEAHSRFLGFARNDKKERVVERDWVVAKG
jgi:hypothetical protein